MPTEKSKRARRAAENLFGDLPASRSTAASRPANPFSDNPFQDCATSTPTSGDGLVVRPFLRRRRRRRERVAKLLAAGQAEDGRGEAPPWTGRR